MKSRFNQYKANLRSYLRNRGAEIDVKRKTIKIDVDSLNWKEKDRLRELEKYGYQVNEAPPLARPTGLMKRQNTETIRLSISQMRL